MIRIALFAALLQTAPAPQAPPPVDCMDANHRAFDFWLGDWDVSPTGSQTVVAHSVISSTAGGCAVQEDYHQTVGPGGVAATYHGASFSTYDQRRGGVWRQFYVDSGGAVTVFEGGVRDGAMVLDAAGGPGVTRRMTIAPQPDGSVRQRGLTSTDGGQTWSGGYDFTYRRRSGG